VGEASLAQRVRSVCTALLGVTEKVSHGALAWFAEKQFVALWPEGHHDHRFPHLWCAAPPGVQDELVTTEPDRFFRPPYVGHRGWIGMRLDSHVDDAELAAVCEEAYRAVAPPKLLTELGPPGR
jgi:hypothetical protein